MTNKTNHNQSFATFFKIVNNSYCSTQIPTTHLLIQQAIKASKQLYPHSICHTIHPSHKLLAHNQQSMNNENPQLNTSQILINEQDEINLNINTEEKQNSYIIQNLRNCIDDLISTKTKEAISEYQSGQVVEQIGEFGLKKMSSMIQQPHFLPLLQKIITFAGDNKNYPQENTEQKKDNEIDSVKELTIFQKILQNPENDDCKTTKNLKNYLSGLSSETISQKISYTSSPNNNENNKKNNQLGLTIQKEGLTTQKSAQYYQLQLKRCKQRQLLLRQLLNQQIRHSSTLKKHLQNNINTQGFIQF